MAINPVAALGPFRVADIPADAFISFESDAGEPISLDGLTPSALQYAPGAAVGTTLETVANEDELRVSVSFGTPFTTPGVYELQIAFDAVGLHETAEPIEFVVEQRDGWLTLAQARKQWADAPVDDVQLYRVLDSAKTECKAYAPGFETSDTAVYWVEDPANPGYLIPATDPAPDATAPPQNYLQAQLMQARNIWNGAKTDPGVTSDGMFTVRPYPLDKFVKDLLRPKRGKPVLG